MTKLIVEMEMPKNCHECEAQCVSALYGRICGMTRRNIMPFLDRPNRPDWCTIKGVLPDEHGDLIDRSELIKHDHQHYEYLSDEYYVTVRDIKAAPTIVPTTERSET